MFTCTFMWVQVHNLPFDCMNSYVGFGVGVFVGKVLHVEIDATGNGWGKFLSILVELDFSKPLVRGKMMVIMNQRIFVQFKHKRLPQICFHRRMITHSTMGYSKNKNMVSDEELPIRQHGAWLRASVSNPTVALSRFVSVYSTGCVSFSFDA